MSTLKTLQGLMKRCRLNQQETAILLGVSKQAVSHWLTGRRDCPDWLDRMLYLLGLYEATSPVLYERIVNQAKTKVAVAEYLRKRQSD